MPLLSLPWLASTLLLCVGRRAACDDSSTSHALNDHEAWQRPAADLVSTKVLDSPEVVLVLDPNGIVCWEEVDLDALTNATLLHWLYQQHDVLTMSTHDSTGIPIEARLASSSSTFCSVGLMVEIDTPMLHSVLNKTYAIVCPALCVALCTTSRVQTNMISENSLLQLTAT